MAENPKPTQTSNPVQGTDMAELLRLLTQAQAQQQQGRLALQQNLLEAVDPLGKTARGNTRPGGLTSNAQWSDTFGGNAASNLSPQALLASQGPSAMNQWAAFGNSPGATQMQEMNRQTGNARFDAAGEGYHDPVAGAVAASPAPFQLNPDTLAMAGLQPAAPTLQSPERTPARKPFRAPAATTMAAPPVQQTRPRRFAMLNA